MSTNHSHSEDCAYCIWADSYSKNKNVYGHYAQGVRALVSQYDKTKSMDHTNFTVIPRHSFFTRIGMKLDAFFRRFF